MLIVGGSFEIEPKDRDAFIASRLDAMRASRAEDGCIEYTFSADPLDDGRVMLFERWESQEALDAHMAAMASAPPPAAGAIAPKGMSVNIYEVSGERSLR